MIRALYAFALVITAILAMALYVAKTEAQSAQLRIAMIQRGIVDERAHIAQLEDELAYMERPQRLEVLAREHLGLRPLAPEQDLTLRYFAWRQQPSPQQRASLMTGVRPTGPGLQNAIGTAQN